MKLFSLLLSIGTFGVALYFFIIKITGSVTTFNDYIYVSLLITLMAICVTGVIINWEILRSRKNKAMIFVSNSFSKKKR